MPRASGQDPELAGDPGRRALRDVVTARGAAAEIGGAGERAYPRIGPHPQVIDAGRSDVPDSAATRQETPLPVLLLSAAVERLIEGPDALERPPADGHVGSPHKLRLAILGPEVQSRDRSAFAAAGPRAPSLQARADRPAEHVVPGRAARPGE